MIKLTVQTHCKRAGIANASILAQRTGFALGTAYKFWNETATRLDIGSLDTLCRVLHTKPQHILLYQSEAPQTASSSEPN